MFDLDLLSLCRRLDEGDRRGQIEEASLVV